MTERRFAAHRIGAMARLLLPLLVPLVLHGCDGSGSPTTDLTVRTKRYMGAPATIQYTFDINYFGQGATGTGCASSFTKTVSVQGFTNNQGHAYDDTVFLNVCPGSWSVTVGMTGWSGQCQQTLNVGANHAYFTYDKPGCNPTSYP